MQTHQSSASSGSTQRRRLNADLQALALREVVQHRRSLLEHLPRRWCAAWCTPIHNVPTAPSAARHGTPLEAAHVYAHCDGPSLSGLPFGTAGDG